MNDWRKKHMSETRTATVATHELAYNNTITIDINLVPDYVWEDLAATTVECVREFLRQPGGREFLDAKIAAKEAALSTSK